MFNAAGRLEALETRVAEQDRVIEELSDEVAKAWVVVERLQNRLAGFDSRFASLEDALPPPAITRPPHW